MAFPTLKVNEQEVPRPVKLLPVAVRKQTASACGPYALESVLRYLKIPVTITRIKKLTKMTRRRGTAPDNMTRAAQKLGFRVRVKEWAELQDLRSALKKNLPPIVLWFSEHEGHYSAVVGMDRRFVYLADPEFGRIRKLAAETFRRVWFDFSTSGPEKHSRLYARWMMILKPPRR